MTMDVTAMTFLMLVLPFVAALVAPPLTRALAQNAAWPLALAPAAIFIYFARYIPAVSNGDVIQGGFAWVPQFDVTYSWIIDGLSLTFLLLISGIGTLIVIYSGGYLKGHPQQGRFLSFLLMFMGAMLGIVVSDSFLMLFIYWELTSITSFLLIGFDHKREASRRAALQALVVTGGGGLFLLAGLLLIWHVTGISSLSALLASGDMMRESPYYLAALILVLGGAFTKSAQFPFHFWLPNAMEAPTPVSAFLHSATMVKAGVFLIMRLNPVFGDTGVWETVLPVFGGLTLLIGTFIGLRQTDLKLTLAYTTVASLGLLVMMTGFGAEGAVEAAVLYLIAHSLFKGSLFMVAGGVDHEAGTRDVTRLSGLGKFMPITFAAAMLAALSMGGLPPFVGFLAKEEIYYALAHGDTWDIVFTVVAIAGNAMMFALAFGVALRPFIGEPCVVPGPHHAHSSEHEEDTAAGSDHGDKSHTVHEAPLMLWLGPVVLAVAGVLAGIFSGTFHTLFSSPMSSAIVGAPVTLEISAIPHISLPFLLSIITVAIGIVMYLAADRLRTLADNTLTAIGWGPDKGFDQFMRGVVRLSHRVTLTLQPGKLEIYVTLSFVFVAAILLVPMTVYGEWPDMPAWPSMMFHEVMIFAIAIIGLFAVALAKGRLTAIVSLGIQGFAVAVIFMLYGAPDLSFTQFMVETLSVVILALVMTRLNLQPTDHRPAVHRIMDASIGAACGLGFGAMLLKSTQVPFNTMLTEFFNAYSKVIAHGHNVVNVIIVDFRATDTLGEIAVVVVTGLAILALIRIRVPSAKPPLKDNPAEAAPETQ
ncbi:hydrogen gas-evolving membrane-bound hydrogenase subunit E [Rhizobium sp. L1K21]|uniref:hydrogen gas-evolving membrane-bound hydrogenase subunit E n=1 Tax=Rhizobium sp. L1K21 TaxID=2954933 RepID=UPI00209294BA|nr:hydrogen gas-evolving membrane-bound hydrogenase subunit E [Rhizobium sp. L1K21]MCO6186733.1 DUF4040 domain-containing protein [Rhizobium sp. L1K21]